MARKNIVDEILDQAMQERSGELPLFDDLPMPNVQEAMSAFRAKAGRKKKPPYRRIMRYAAAFILLIGLSAGLYAAVQNNLPQTILGGMQATTQDNAGSAAQGGLQGNSTASAKFEVTEQLGAEWQNAINTFTESATFIKLSKASEYFRRMPVFPDATPDRDLVEFYETAEPPAQSELTYQYVFADGSLDIYCANTDPEATQKLAANLLEVADPLSLANLNAEVYVIQNETGVASSAVWTNNEDMLFIVSAVNMEEEAFYKHVYELRWYE